MDIGFAAPVGKGKQLRYACVGERRTDRKQAFRAIGSRTDSREIEISRPAIDRGDQSNSAAAANP